MQKRPNEISEKRLKELMRKPGVRVTRNDTNHARWPSEKEIASYLEGVSPATTEEILKALDR